MADRKEHPETDEGGGFWNREFRGLLVLTGLLMLLGMGGVWLLVGNYCALRDREQLMAVAALLNSVLEKYPETSEEELVAILNGKAESDRGEQLLGQYGMLLNREGIDISGADQILRRLQAGLFLWGAAFFCVLILVLVFYFRRRRREIEELCGYVRQVSRGNYNIDVSGNRDTELSSLKNELYKVTVLLKEQAAGAVKSKRALADAMADISHQLKTPLTSVRVLTDNLLENEGMEPDVRSRFLREISGQLSGVTWLINALLKISRLDAGVVQMEVRSLSLRVLLEEVCSRLEFLSELRQVTLKLRMEENIRIFGDDGWLKEAFLNLVKNALEHSYSGGTVEIMAEENQVYTQVSIRDYGEGVDVEEQRHLFERFYRGKTAGKNSVGIGLALSKEIIGRQGGYISMESVRGKGTVFFVKFLKCH